MASPTSTRKRITHWLDTTGRVFAESPLTALSTSALSLTLLPPSRRPQHAAYYPRPVHLGLFSAAFLLSAGMCQQGYTVDAAGTGAAWGTLFLAVNGWKRGVRGVLKGRLAPAVLVGKVLFDTAVLGWYWGNTRRWVPDAER